VRVVVSLDAIEGALARVGQAVEMDNNTRRAQGRVIHVFKECEAAHAGGRISLTVSVAFTRAT